MPGRLPEAVPHPTLKLVADRCNQSHIETVLAPVMAVGERQDPRSALSSESLHRHGLRSLFGRAITKLAVGVVAPALHRAVSQERASVRAAGSDCNRLCDAGHVHQTRRGDSWSIAELPVVVAAPAIDRTVGKERAAMVHPGGDPDGLRDSGTAWAAEVGPI